MNNTSAFDKPVLLLFDVNETLLDLSSIKTRINQAFGYDFAFNQWFTLMLHYSLVDTVTGHYHPFGEIGKAAFQMTAQLLGKAISDSERDDILQLMRQLPPHPDVPEALEQLRKAGYRMATLTNSTGEVLAQQMQASGLATYFEACLSIDLIKQYKPAPNAYHAACNKLGVPAQSAMLIAAHGWDICGALHAGLQAAFISRKGQALYPLAPKPRFTGDTLLSLAAELIRL